MTAFRPVIINNGTQSQLPNADSLLVGTGIDVSTAGALTIGGTTATSVTIGSASITTDFPGPVTLTGDVTTVGGTTFTTDATFEGDVTFGNAATDTVSFVAEVDTDIAFKSPGYRVTGMLDPTGPSTQEAATAAWVTSQIAAIPATSPGAPFNSIQFNNAGAFGGSSSLQWNGSGGTNALATPIVSLAQGTVPSNTAGFGKVWAATADNTLHFYSNSIDYLVTPNSIQTLTYAASVALDFDPALPPLKSVALTGDIAFTSSNLGASRNISVRIIGDTVSRNLTSFPAGWTWLGGTAPTVLEANKTAILSLASFSTTDANVVASWSYDGSVNVTSVTASAPLSSSGGTTPNISLGTVGIANGGTGVTTVPTNGQLLIGNGTGYAVAGLTAGSGVTITPGVGSITISATGTGGTVTSVDVSGGTTGLTFSGGPITSSGTITMAGTLDADNGGTGQSAYTAGDLLYASGAAALSKLAIGSANTVLRSNGSAPSWGQVALTTDVSGVLPVANGGSGTSTAFTAGSIVFAGASGIYSQDNANLFWDDTSNRLGIGTASPSAALTVSGGITQSSGAVSLTANAASSFSTSAGDLDLSAFANLDLDGASVDIDATSAVSIGAAAASDFTVAGANLTLATTTSGTLALSSAGLLDVEAAANLDLDVTGTMDLLSSGAFSIDGTGASNLSATSGALTLSTITSGDLLLSSAADVEIAAAASGEVVVNEAGLDVDFRVEGDTNTHALFVEGSSSHVGVGTSNVAGHLFNIGSGATANFAVASGGKIHIYGGAAPTDGQVLVGNTAQGRFDAATITAGTGVSITNGAGTITIAATGLAAGTIALTTTGLTVGDVAYVSSNDTGASAIATAASTSRVAGFVSTVGAPGTVQVTGTATANFITGLTGLAAGQPVYLSKTAGKLTNDVSAFTTGDVVAEIGIAASVSSATGGAAAASVLFQPKSIVVL